MPDTTVENKPKILTEGYANIGKLIADIDSVTRGKAVAGKIFDTYRQVDFQSQTGDSLYAHFHSTESRKDSTRAGMVVAIEALLKNAADNDLDSHEIRIGDTAYLLHKYAAPSADDFLIANRVKGMLDTLKGAQRDDLLNRLATVKIGPYRSGGKIVAASELTAHLDALSDPKVQALLKNKIEADLALWDALYGIEEKTKAAKKTKAAASKASLKRTLKPGDPGAPARVESKPRDLEAEAAARKAEAERKAAAERARREAEAAKGSNLNPSGNGKAGATPRPQAPGKTPGGKAQQKIAARGKGK